MSVAVPTIGFFVCLSVLFFFGESRIHQSNIIGGETGTVQAFDDIAENGLQNGVLFRLQNILLLGSTESQPITACQARYGVSRLGTEDLEVLNGQVAGNPRFPLVVENASLVISLSATDIVSRMYGYYSPDQRFGGVFVLNTVGFDVLRGNGSMESYIVGNRDGVHVPSILGPIVGFYARRGLAIDALGAYVDPSLWPDRPSRLVMLRTGGRTYGHGNAYSFDHNMELGEPFVIRIAKVVIYYDSNKIRGMQVVYEDHLRNRTPISSGNTTSPSQSVTVVFELGDYIKVLDINGDFNSQISGAFL